MLLCYLCTHTTPDGYYWNNVGRLFINMIIYDKDAGNYVNEYRHILIYALRGTSHHEYVSIMKDTATCF